MELVCRNWWPSMGFGEYWLFLSLILLNTSTNFCTSCFSVFLPTVTATHSTTPPPQASLTQLLRLQRLPPRLFRCGPQYVGVGTLLPSWQMQQQQHQQQWYDVCPPRRTMLGRVQRCPLLGLCQKLRQTRHHLHQMFRWGQLPQCLSLDDWICTSCFSVASWCLCLCPISQKRNSRKWYFWSSQNHFVLSANFSSHARCL